MSYWVMPKKKYSGTASAMKGAPSNSWVGSFVERFYKKMLWCYYFKTLLHRLVPPYTIWYAWEKLCSTGSSWSSYGHGILPWGSSRAVQKTFVSRISRMASFFPSAFKWLPYNALKQLLQAGKVLCLNPPSPFSPGVCPKSPSGSNPHFVLFLRKTTKENQKCPLK